MTARACALGSVELDDLATGTILLTVPVLDGAIQVGIGGEYPTGTIVVSKTVSTVRMRYLHGGPMQVHLVEGWQHPGAPGTRTTVFAHPVDRLTLDRRGTRWAVAGPAGGARPAALAAFVGTVARFALLKQHKSGQGAGAA
ncbi:hypothetical protein ACWDTP_24115 [Mycobacterium sp. NPDC003449]